MDMDEMIRNIYHGVQRQGCGTMVIVMAVLLLLLCGCKTKDRVVVVTEHHTDTTYVTKWKLDSVWVHDSIHVKEKGDTVWMEKWHTKYVEKVSHDTTYVSKTDSVPVPYPVTENVEKSLSWWQKMRLWLGNMMLLAIVALTGYGGWKMYKKFA